MGVFCVLPLSNVVDEEVMLIDVDLHTRGAAVELQQSLRAMLHPLVSFTLLNQPTHPLTCIIFGSPFL